MQNQQFLIKLIELYQTVYIKEPILLLNPDGIVLFAGEKIKDIINIDLNNIIGKNHLCVLPLPKENHTKIIASINKVIRTGTTQEFLSINLNHPEDSLILDCTLKPIINPSNNSIVAISVESRKLTYPIYFYKMLMFTDAAPTTLNNRIKHNDQLLTLREHEIAFLLFYCKTAEKISQILSKLYNKLMAPKTINNIIRQQLYPKFDVYNLDSLQDKLYTMNYHKKIPVSFLCNLYLDLSKI